VSVELPGPRLSTPQRLGYAVGDFGFNLYWQATALYLYFFYTDVMGLPPGAAGLAYAMASFWDAISDPIMGTIADRTRSRWGSYRPYILFGAIPCALAFVLCFWASPLAKHNLLLYATATLILLRTLYTVANIPYIALSAKLTSDYQERGVLAGMRMMFAASGGLVVAFLMPFLVERRRDNPVIGWVSAASALAIVATIVLALCFLATREPDAASGSRDQESRASTSIVRDIIYFWTILRRNAALARLFIAITAAYAAGQMFSKMLVYWFKYGLHNAAVAKYALALSPIAMILATPFWVWVGKRTSKRTAWLCGIAISAAGVIAFFFDFSNSVAVTLILVAVISIGTICTPLMFFSMIPDTVDYNEAQLGRRDEAKIFGFAIFAQKAALAINAIVLGQLLELIRFVANQQQSAAALLGMKTIMTIVPLLGMLVTAVAIWRYPLDAGMHARILQQLRVRRSQPENERAG
jgi:glycoside/pentoside/hexuronide:cation symporter, GPH family